MSFNKESNINILDILQNKPLVKVCAPMVRYSKLQFRNLVKLYDCDLNFTPMILADSFCESEKARNNEFTTNFLDTPLVVQFAANTVHDFVGGAYLASPYCNGVDLNCGCPQRWAKEEGLGCGMLKKPELVYDMIRQCRNRISKPFTVSVKMRLLNDDKNTVEICKQLEKCDVTFLTVHGRTPTEIVGEINKDALKLVRENCNIPVIANGGVTNLKECFELQEYTGCKGVMVANGMLTNPMLFSGNSVTSIDCIQNWLDICYNSTLTQEGYEVERKKPRNIIPDRPFNLTFQVFHHHLVFMLEKVLPRRKRQMFNSLKSFSTVLQFLEDYFSLKPRLFEPNVFSKYVNFNLNYSERQYVYEDLKPVDLDNKEIFTIYDADSKDGKYFCSKISTDNNDSCDWSDLFMENG